MAHEYYKKSLELFISYAEKNRSSYLAYRIGKMYLYGLGTEPCPTTAEKWLIKAVNEQNKYAEYTLGMMYVGGNGVEQNIEKGMELIKRSADKKNPYALFSVLNKKMDTDFSSELAPYLSILQELANHQNESASYFLGKLLEDGKVLEKDDEKAVHYYLQVANSNPYASYRLGNLLLESEQLEPDLQARLRWLEKSAEDGNPYAQ